VPWEWTSRPYEAPGRYFLQISILQYGILVYFVEIADEKVQR